MAILADRGFGEPPARLHPVVWLGRLISALDRKAPRAGKGRKMVYGAALVWTVVAAAGIPAALLTRSLGRLPWTLRVIAVGLALKPAFAWRSLGEHAARIVGPLEAGDLPAARHALSMIVSRDTAALDAARIVAAAVESVAENTSDSVVAPLFWYAVGGLPGAWAYRAANTMDAMIGYRDEQYEWLGKPAARLDDLLNWLPARITAVLFAALSPLVGGSPARAIQVLWRDRGNTASPNAGWPMAAMAGSLGVELEKVDLYRLGAGQRLPGVPDVRAAVRLLDLTAVVAACLAAMVRALRR